MSQQKSLSVVLATFNEAQNIVSCLESVASIADEIIIVDGASTDKTLELAARFNPTIIKTSNKPMFHINKQKAIQAANKDWILQLDADEVVDAELATAIKNLLSKDDSQINAYWLKRKNYFLGGFLTKGGQYPDKVIRLFRKGFGALPQKDVHEQIEINGAVTEIPGHLLHYNAPTFSRYIVNANRYTSLTAQKLFEKKVQLNFFNTTYYLAYKPLITFCRLFFRHRGYKDGFRGFVFALFSGLHFGLAYIKLSDLYRESQV